MQAKLREYLASGAKLGWLLDLDRDLLEIYRPGGQVETLTGSQTQCSGEQVLPGLSFRAALKALAVRPQSRGELEAPPAEL